MPDGRIVKIASTIDRYATINHILGMMPSERVYNKGDVMIEYLDGGHATLWARMNAATPVRVLDKNTNAVMSVYDGEPVQGTLVPGTYHYRVTGLLSDGTETANLDVAATIPPRPLFRLATVANTLSVLNIPYADDNMDYATLNVQSPTGGYLINRNEVFSNMRVISIVDTTQVLTDRMFPSFDNIAWKFDYIGVDDTQPIIIQKESGPNVITYGASDYDVDMDEGLVIFKPHIAVGLNARSHITITYTVMRYVEAVGKFDDSVVDSAIYTLSVGNELNYETTPIETVQIIYERQTTRFYSTVFFGASISVGNMMRVLTTRKAGYDYEVDINGNINFENSAGVAEFDGLEVMYDISSPTGTVGLAIRLRQDLTGIRVYKLQDMQISGLIYEGSEVDLQNSTIDTIVYDTGSAPLPFVQLPSVNAEPPHVDSVMTSPWLYLAGMWIITKRGPNDIALSI